MSVTSELAEGAVCFILFYLFFLPIPKNVQQRSFWEKKKKKKKRVGEGEVGPQKQRMGNKSERKRKVKV